MESWRRHLLSRQKHYYPWNPVGDASGYRNRTSPTRPAVRRPRPSTASQSAMPLYAASTEQCGTGAGVAAAIGAMGQPWPSLALG